MLIQIKHYCVNAVLNQFSLIWISVCKQGLYYYYASCTGLAIATLFGKQCQYNSIVLKTKTDWYTLAFRVLIMINLSGCYGPHCEITRIIEYLF